MRRDGRRIISQRVFISWAVVELPSEDEQFEAYRKVAVGDESRIR